MKKFIVFLLFLSLLSCTENKKPQRDSEGNVLKNGQFYSSEESETREVWICTGKKSHAYHSSETCYGIQACRGDIVRIPIEEALALGRTPCHYCHELDDLKENDPDTYDPLNDYDSMDDY